MTPDPVIVVHTLTRCFDEVAAVDHLSLDVAAGEVFGLLGHNGAGKTTTIRLLNGVLEPSSGKAQVLGFDPVTEGPDLRRCTGVLTETPCLDQRLTGRENLHIYAELYGVPRAEVTGRIDRLLDIFELAGRADEKVSDYSRGMKQRLALTRALLHQPEVLFLDEPTAALDPIAARRVHAMITHLSSEERRTVLLCTHNLVEAQRLCDRVAVLDHGRLVALGTPAELARDLGQSLRLELEVAPDGVPAAMRILAAAGHGVAPLVQENGLLTVTASDRDVIPELVAAFVAGGVRIYRLSPQEPSLEDIYFALHGEAEGLG
jgi:ABC-2 type transport system ATP-binding protein